MTTLAMMFESDFVQAADGSFRAASPMESIRQDAEHLMVENQYVARPSTTPTTAEMQSDLVAQLKTNPAVVTIDRVDVAPQGNGLAVALQVNSNPQAITLTTGS